VTTSAAPATAPLPAVAGRLGDGSTTLPLTGAFPGTAARYRFPTEHACR
jgi:hypothetical protein